MIPVKRRDTVPFASAGCPQCKGKGEYEVKVERTRRDGKRKRVRQLVTYRTKSHMCACAVLGFMQVQKCQVLETGQLVALEPYEHLSEETRAEWESQAKPIPATIDDHVGDDGIPGGTVGDGSAKTEAS